MTGPETEIEKMKGELAELKDKLSRQRKQGIDVLIAQLKITSIPSKLKMAEITHSGKDIEIVRARLEEARAELKATAHAQAQPESESEENFKKGQTTFNKLKDCIERAKEAARLGKKEEAKVLYGYVRQYYPMLASGQKKQIAQECQQLTQQLNADAE